jgi:hypothetical protein
MGTGWHSSPHTLCAAGPRGNKKLPIGSGQHPQTIAKGYMRDGCALLLRDKEYNDTDSEQTRHERESKQAWVVVIKGTQQPHNALVGPTIAPSVSSIRSKPKGVRISRV